MITPAAILEAVSCHYGIEIRQIRGTNRCRDVAAARAVGMYLTRKTIDMSFPRIGAFYGGKDHTTVMAAVAKVEGWLVVGDRRASHVAAIKDAIDGCSVEILRRHLEMERGKLLRNLDEVQTCLRALPAGAPPGTSDVGSVSGIGNGPDARAA